MSAARDTKFAGFAKLLLAELLEAGDVHIDTSNPYWRAEWEQMIARRAYDLACHVATETILTAHGDMGKISDMAEWPKEQD